MIDFYQEIFTFNLSSPIIFWYTKLTEEGKLWENWLMGKVFTYS